MAPINVMLYTFLLSWHTLSYVMFIKGEVMGIKNAKELIQLWVN
jgi:hypothetical protein